MLMTEEAMALSGASKTRSSPCGRWHWLRHRVEDMEKERKEVANQATPTENDGAGRNHQQSVMKEDGGRPGDSQHEQRTGVGAGVGDEPSH